MLMKYIKKFLRFFHNIKRMQKIQKFLIIIFVIILVCGILLFCGVKNQEENYK